MTSTPRHGRHRERSLADILYATDEAMKLGAPPGAHVWPTGFRELDRVLDGGIRAGELVLVGGGEGVGKTTLAVQILRNIATAGEQALMFSFEHRAHTLLERLLALESAELAIADGHLLADAADVPAFRSVFEAPQPDRAGLLSAMQELPYGGDALGNVESYGRRLRLHESDAQTTPEEISLVIQDVINEAGEPPIVLLDYLQKVPVSGGDLDETARVTMVAEQLKALALELGCAVVAIVAGERESLETGRRMRAHDFRGSSALAYEADVILVVASKENIVAREHLVYDLGNVDRFRGWAVVTVEKNRHGVGKIEFEIEKDFAHGRFEPLGGAVHEHLVEGRVFTA